jgi:tRNA threonylcarbamoyladenosine biosynthesis protein TsaE
MQFQTASPEETFHLGETYGAKAVPGAVIALQGGLGAGKTVFTKGFAKGLGVTETVTSPTFTIMQVYESGRLPLYHFDVYRIEEPEEMEEVGFDEYVDGDGVCLIEWANRIEEILPADTIYIVIEKDLSKGLDYRKITVVRPGEGS